jgi:tetratricopeptide (TPR) repeat protein
MGTREIGRYTIEGEAVARDAFGTLFLGTDRETGAPVYIKESARGSSVRAGVDDLRAFDAVLHGSLVKASEDIHEGGKRYVAVARPDGELLQVCLPRLRSGGLTGRHVLLRAVIDVCRALEALHRAGLAYGQLSPATVHVRLKPTVQAFLLCFSPARPLQAHAVIEENPLLQYLAQEQLRGGFEMASDVYGVGMLLFGAFASAPPFQAASPYALAEAIVRGELAPFVPEQGDVDPALREAVAPDLETIGAVASRALRRLPRNRYSTVGEMMRVLEQIAHRLSPIEFGISLYEHRQFDLAATVLEESAATQDAARARVYLGRIYGLEQGHHERGVAEFRRALKEHPDLEIATDGLADLYVKNGHLALARREIFGLLQKDPASARWNLRYAEILEQGGDPDGAVNVCRRVAETNPFELVAYIRTIRIHLAQSKVREAEACCDRAIDKILEVLTLGNLDRARVAEVFYLRGLLHRRVGRADRALVWLQKALEQLPSYPDAHALLSDLYGEAGEADKAVHHFLAGLGAAPDKKRIMEMLSRLLSRDDVKHN